jgi:hypothetical protein
MITAVFAFVGAMVGAIFINYCLHSNNPNWEEPIRKNGSDN